MTPVISPKSGTGVPVQIAGVSRTFPNGTQALSPIDLTIPAGQFISILGPSGCGKSTLLRLIAGVDKPTTGNISTTKSRNGVAFVFQDAHLLPWRNTLDNVALPLELKGIPKAERRSEATRVLEQVGLLDAAERYPAQLSGGMRMRVSLARALVTNPRLLLLDEPFAALDEITRQRLDEQLHALWQDGRMTVVFVTHSVSEAVFLSQRSVVMSRRPGRIVLDRQIDLPETRKGLLRTDAAFSGECRILYEALEH